MKIYGLTGGIAAGKSEASRQFRKRGVPVIDSDRIGHEAIEAGGIAERAVVAEFGEAILTEGQIDREKLGAIVFADPKALEKLNGLVHPAVRQEIARQTAALLDDGHEFVIVEAALHAEDGKLGEGLEGLILVQCPREERVRRLMADRGMSEEEAIRRIEAQTPPENKTNLARWVIMNTADISDLHRQVDEIVEEL